MDARGPVLIVDDDEDIRDVVALTLQTTGYPVATAADGLDALRQIRGGLQPSLILLDMMMPRMDGETFLNTLRSEAILDGTPVVLLSGHSAVRQKAAELHVDGCLVKPVELDALLGAVQRFAAPR